MKREGEIRREVWRETENKKRCRDWEVQDCGSRSET